MSLIEINHLVKVYPNSENIAVNDIRLSVGEREIFGLLGPNGAGKTTTLSMLCGLIHPTSGEIVIDGKNIATHLDEIRSIIGVVPQDIALYPSLTASENLMYYGALYGIEKKELKNRIKYWLDKFSLTEKANKLVETYSGGMKRRTNLIAGILHQPKILILDEPTVGIDVQSRAVITAHLKQLNEAGMTIIYTSHHMEEAQNLCDRIAIIDNGKIIISGNPNKLIEETPNVKNLEDIFIAHTGKAIRD
jgi:ABC-2 type transport system ATP-binding protein